MAFVPWPPVGSSVTPSALTIPAPSGLSEPRAPVQAAALLSGIRYVGMTSVMAEFAHDTGFNDVGASDRKS